MRQAQQPKTFESARTVALRLVQSDEDEVELWERYERGKETIARKAKTPREYEVCLAELAEELGL